MSNRKKDKELIDSLPNFSALTKLAPLWDDNKPESLVARVFVCEDIIEMDVENWKETALNELLSQFSDYTSDAVDAYITAASEDDVDLTDLYQLKNSFLSTISVMLKYVEAHEIIRNA